MVEACDLPACGQVAVLATEIGRDMVKPFAYRDYVVVTSVANTDDLTMIDLVHGYPGLEVMTGLAIVAGTDVANVFSGCNHLVVATYTAGVADRCVIEGYLPIHGIVAVFAR